MTIEQLKHAREWLWHFAGVVFGIIGIGVPLIGFIFLCGLAIVIFWKELSKD
jgi:hypothetical protein